MDENSDDSNAEHDSNQDPRAGGAAGRSAAEIPQIASR